VACEPVYSDARADQIDLEWRGGHRFGFVDRESLWVV
jgi:hypothetical protein